VGGEREPRPHPHRAHPAQPERGEGGGDGGPPLRAEAQRRLPGGLLPADDRLHRQDGLWQVGRQQQHRRAPTPHTPNHPLGSEGQNGYAAEVDGGRGREKEAVDNARLQGQGPARSRGQEDHHVHGAEALREAPARPFAQEVLAEQADTRQTGFKRLQMMPHRPLVLFHVHCHTCRLCLSGHITSNKHSSNKNGNNRASPLVSRCLFLFCAQAWGLGTLRPYVARQGLSLPITLSAHSTGAHSIIFL
jgi:hypothetical protein